jgi:nitric oxide reductase subunit B
LHRQSEIVLNDWAREQGAANYAALPAESRAALQGRLTELTRHKTYDPRADTIVLDTEHAKAFDELTKYCADVYGQGRNEYAIPAGALTDPAKQHQMEHFSGGPLGLPARIGRVRKSPTPRIGRMKNSSAIAPRERLLFGV